MTYSPEDRQLAQLDDPASRPPTEGNNALPVHHPAVSREIARAEDLQVRVADLITRFAGSMPFVYVHVAVFAAWMLFAEDSPWPTLTLVVSLEAIFLSTFVMIGQNGQARFQRAKADHDFLSEEQELRLNTDLTRTIEHLVREIHAKVNDHELPWTPGPENDQAV